jgi:tRNA-specific 2-thiouridylase
MNETRRVVVAMSGGVDSSVAAALLKRQGHEVIGMMMRLWSEPGKEDTNRCCTPDAMAQARRVAAILDIPFYAVDAQNIFHDVVVDYFINGYTQGETPNPCLACNQQIRWEFLLQRALTLGASHMATGHYARLAPAPDGSISLLRGIDLHKDQSYILHVLTREKLAHALFPLGGYTKTEVRQLARDFNLPVAERAESQDLCFLGDGNYRDFLMRNAAGTQIEGDIANRFGQVLGRHHGLAFYTIGQRKGIGISGTVPLYVLEKDQINNRLIVGDVSELGHNELTATNVNWISAPTPDQPFRAQVKIRYKAREVEATVIPLNAQTIRVHFDEPMRDITPGQAVVLYQGHLCLGGGVIRRAQNSFDTITKELEANQ